MSTPQRATPNPSRSRSGRDSVASPSTRRSDDPEVGRTSPRTAQTQAETATDAERDRGENVGSDGPGGKKESEAKQPELTWADVSIKILMAMAIYLTLIPLILAIALKEVGGAL